MTCGDGSFNKTFPMDVRHYDGNPCSHRKAHNIYGTQMAELPWGEAFCISKEDLYYNKISYAGDTALFVFWTGDNVATWEHLWLQIYKCKRMSISEWALLVLISADSRSNHLELYTRWIQLGVFHPFAQHIPPRSWQEPWDI
jgi:alpha-glucosidase